MLASGTGNYCHPRMAKTSRTSNFLGFLSMVSYGSWFYGFGVLLPEFTSRYELSEAALGGVYGITTLFGGVIAIACGRLLDNGNITRVLRFIGPLGALCYALSVLSESSVLFVVLFVIGGGIVGGTGFYSLTQSILLRRHDHGHIADVTRLTVWGAFASPIFIPFTEFLRSTFGLVASVVVPSFIVAVAFLLASASVSQLTVIAPSAGHLSKGLRASFRLMLQPGPIAWLWTSGVVGSVASSALMVYQIPTMRAAGLAASSAAFFAGARGFTQLLGRLPLVWLIQKFGVKPLWIFSRTLIALSCVVLAFSGNYVTALLYVLLAGFSIGSLSALDGMVSREFLPIGDLGTLNGILSLSYGVSSMVGLVVFGWINGVSTSRTPSAILMALTAMIAVCMSLPLLRARSSTAQVPATP